MIMMTQTAFIPLIIVLSASFHSSTHFTVYTFIDFETSYSPSRPTTPTKSINSRGTDLDCSKELNASFKNFFEGADSLLSKINIKKKYTSKESNHGLNGANKPEEESTLTATAIKSFSATEEDMISFKKSQKITNIKTNTGYWWRGKCHGIEGRFPSNHVMLDYITY